MYFKQIRFTLAFLVLLLIGSICGSVSVLAFKSNSQPSTEVQNSNPNSAGTNSLIQPGDTRSNSQTYQTYEDPQNGFRISYPSYAQLEKVPVGIQVTMPSEGWRFGVLGTKNTEGHDLDKIVDDIVDFQTKIGFEHPTKTNVNVEGHPAIMISYTDDSGGSSKRVWKIFFLANNDKLFELQQEANLNDYKKYTPIFAQMMASFELL